MSEPREAFFERSNWRCFYCGCAVYTNNIYAEENGVPPGQLAEVEHKQPRCRGGTDAARNLTTACQACNRRKGSKTLEEYRAFVAIQRQRSILKSALALEGIAYTSYTHVTEHLLILADHLRRIHLRNDGRIRPRDVVFWGETPGAKKGDLEMRLEYLDAMIYWQPGEPEGILPPSMPPVEGCVPLPVVEGEG